MDFSSGRYVAAPGNKGRHGEPRTGTEEAGRAQSSYSSTASVMEI
jgi:hypothetical protein